MATLTTFVSLITCVLFVVTEVKSAALGDSSPGSVNINIHFNHYGSQGSLDFTRNSYKDLVSQVKTFQDDLAGHPNGVKQLYHTVNDLRYVPGTTTVLVGQTLTTKCSYSPGAIKAGAQSITIPNEACRFFKADTEVLLHQTQASLASAGIFERARVKNCTKNILHFSSPLINAYSSGSFGGSSPKVTQIVPIYKFASLVVCDNAVLQPPNWNGKCGGILALQSADITVCSGSAISASGKGFRGAPQFVSNTDYVNGYVGESELVGYEVTRQPAGIGSGGGSGNGNGGGYGGAHTTRGSAPATGGCARATPKAPANLLQDHERRVYFGGSGGASGSHHKVSKDPIRKGARGGQSGGIVYIDSSGQLHVQASGGIAAEGMKGQDGYLTSVNQYMGGGGGGAGGTVYLRQTGKRRLQPDIEKKIRVDGGLGGQGFVGGGCSPSGKGGSGGKGRILLV